jgi:hypothetical protein
MHLVLLVIRLITVLKKKSLKGAKKKKEQLILGELIIEHF